ncbi:GNAT family N-acetyltransferase [Methylocystis sp. IM2]|uniref:GNAT family N-acetyltransferase n=1 Tax=unclassified Methylocystis TaxID=2625913 RepID=UPI0030F4D732
MRNSEKRTWTHAIIRAHPATNWKSIEKRRSLHIRLKGNIITFIPTEALPEISGQGAVARLIAVALEDVRARGRKLRSICPLVTSYAQRHPEVHDLLAGGTT